MFRLDDVYKTYQLGTDTLEALRGIDLHAELGEFVAVVGHSGSGKSTLLSVMGGLTRPTQGQVLLDGIDLWSTDDDGRARLRNTMVGFIFQFSSLIPTLTSLGNLLLPRMFGPEGIRPQDYARAEELLSLVGLEEKAYAYPNELSGGQQRRVAIARGLINDPQLILADEPTGDLDEDTEHEVMKLLLQATRERQAALIMVTHNLHLAEQADRTLRMRKGEIQ